MRGTLALCFSLSLFAWTQAEAGGAGAVVIRDSDNRTVGVIPPDAADQGRYQAGQHSQSDHAISDVPAPEEPDLEPIPEGLAGYDVAISIDGTVQFFTDFQLQTSGTGSATQDASGNVRLTVVPCDPELFFCSSLAAVRAMVPGSFFTGTTIQFYILQTQAITPDLTTFSVPAHCRLDRLPNASTIAGTYFEVDADAIGLHEVRLDWPEPDGIVLHCELRTRSGF